MRAAIYTRYSTSKQDSRSIEDQQRRCTEFAAARGWTVGRTYQDAEISGTQLARPGLDQLRADARARRFDVIVVDDLSRLSRDLGAGWNLVFTEFDGSGVIVADVMTGMISTDPAAKMTFATLGLVNMMGVEAVRHQTRRGLDSRARGGFATGGPCFGYRSVDEPGAADPRHVRKVLVIHEAEAEVVQEVFTRWSAGESFKAIAADLSARGLPAPRTGPKKWRAWGATSVRYVLRNRRYIGEFTWNQRRFVKDPVTGRRRPLPRPPSEHVTTIQPQLAIVDRATFDRAQARFQTKAGHPEGATFRHPPHPLRGLIKCGECGSSMIIGARETTGGELFTYVRCSLNTNQGNHVCSNGRTVEIGRVIETIYDARVREATAPERREQLVDAVLASYATDRQADPRAGLQRELVAAKARAKNVLDAIANLGLQADLAARYKGEQARVVELEAQLAQAPATTHVPTREDVLWVIAGLEDSPIQLTPEQVAVQLRERFDRVEMHPNSDGWEVRAFPRFGISCSGGEIVALGDVVVVAWFRRAAKVA